MKVKRIVIEIEVLDTVPELQVLNRINTALAGLRHQEQIVSVALSPTRTLPQVK